MRKDKGKNNNNNSKDREKYKEINRKEDKLAKVEARTIICGRIDVTNLCNNISS